MAESRTQLFAYGTLMPGEGNHRQIEEHVHQARPGVIKGILVDLGAFPALIPGDGIVRGVLLDADLAVVKLTDRIEGCSPDPDQCLYRRELVGVHVEGEKQVPAWTYFFANPDQIADRPRLIVGEKDGFPIGAWSSA